MKIFNRKITVTKSTNASPQGVNIMPLFYPQIDWSEKLQLLSSKQEDLVKDIFNKTNNLYSIVKYHTEKGSQIPWGLYRVNEAGEKIKIEKNHELKDKLNNPNEYEDYKEFFGKYLAYWLVMGNSYINRLIPVGFGSKDTSYHILPAQHVFAVLSDQAKNLDFRSRAKYHLGYEVKGIDPASNNIAFLEKEEVFHRRMINLSFDKNEYLFGLSPLVPANAIVSATKYNEEARASIMQERGALGLLTNDSENIPINQTDAKDVQDKLQNKYGLQRGKRKVIVTSAKLRWEQMGMNLGELELIDNANLNLSDLCRTYSTDPILLGYKEFSSYNNVKEARVDFYQGTFKPEIDSIFNDFSRFMIDRKQYPDFYYLPEWDKVSEMQIDVKDKIETFKTAVQHSLISPYSAAKKLGFDDEGQSKELYIMKNLIPISQINKQENSNNL